MELFKANIDTDFPSDPLTYTKIYDLFSVYNLAQCKEVMDAILEDISQITQAEVEEWTGKDLERIESGLMALQDLIRQKAREIAPTYH
jgi:cyanate lyase